MLAGIAFLIIIVVFVAAIVYEEIYLKTLLKEAHEQHKYIQTIMEKAHEVHSDNPGSQQ